MAVLALVLTAATVTALPAQAATTGTCGGGSIGVSFNPALGTEVPPNLPTVSVGLIAAQTGTFLCQFAEPASSEHAQITGLAGTVQASCITSSNADIDLTIKWTDRSPIETSVVEIGNFALTTNGASKAVLLSGVVESGRFLNQTIKVEAASEGDTTRCATHTFSDTHGPATIELS